MSEGDPRPRRRLRRAAIGMGATALGVAAAVAAERAAARRLRARDDPEDGVPIGLLPPEDLGPITSFDGTQIAVRAAGPERAPTIVFSHGFSLDMTTWHYQWTALSDRYRCVLFDHRAHGRSGMPPDGDYSMTAMARDLHAVLDHVAPKGPVLLAGHSMGGMAIIALAAEHPEEFGSRVRGVVLADTAASDVLREFLGNAGARLERLLRPITTRLTRDPGRVERFRGRISGVTDLAFLIAKATQFGPEASPSHVDYVARLSAGAPVEIWIHTLRDFMELDLSEGLANVAVPALVVVGDRDMVTPKTSAAALRLALPDARAVVITRAGHVSMMEQHTVFNEVLEGYLTEVFPPRRRRARVART